ncbi:hypothetical protein BBJ28_00008556 [Nothophytophthora sp. Chile5]|nr:hypothetical protein BBJ28_00008556 [Nothophytophthora sp. Chile5]
MGSVVWQEAACRWLAAALVFWAVTSSALPDSRTPEVGAFNGGTAPLSRLAFAVDQDSELKDPIMYVRLVYPLDGAVEKPPVKLIATIGVRPRDVERFQTRYNEMHMCIETDNVTYSCSHMTNKAHFQHWDLGTHTVRAFITDASSFDAATSTRYWQSALTTFTVVNDVDFEAHLADLMQEEDTKHRPGYDLALVQWAAQQQRQQNAKLLAQLEHDDLGAESASTKGMGTGDLQQVGGDREELVLLIGIKTAIATNFPLRQAIRETWASRETLPREVKVVFVGCRPFAAVTHDDDSNTERGAENRQLWEAIELEKLVYGDLLTDELECDDTYLDLANKVKEFLHFAATKYSHAQYVMVADDDLYVQMDQLVQKFQSLGPQQRFYSGQVPSIQNARKDTPTRDTNTRHGLSEAQYPLSEIPPFAMGAYFFLSMDCVQFVSKNRRRLQDLGGMDDITMALWMLAIQVHVQHWDDLNYLRKSPCKEGLVAFGDLSPSAIRDVHKNIHAQRPFCHGFHRYTWLKPKCQAPADGHYRSLLPLPELLQFDITIPRTGVWGPLQVTAIVSTTSRAGVKAVYFPSTETLLAFSRRVCAQTRLNLPGAAGASSCAEIGKRLRSELQAKYQQIKAAETVETSRLALWGHNLFVDDQAAPPMIIAYTSGVAPSSILFECIFASMHEPRPVLVLNEFTLHRRYGGHPDVLVFSILDGDCQYYLRPDCKRTIADFLDRYHRPRGVDVAGAEKPCHVVMLSGEAWELDGLDARVLLISTVKGVRRTKHVYLPMASVSFAERLEHDPTALLMPQQGRSVHHPIPPRKFCAYMYARCDRQERELMFDLLNELEPVDALGRCSGGSKPPDSQPRTTGSRSEWYNDDAVLRYESYKFVIAFENSRASGYVTEKLVNAFLAGSVPIYFGNSTTVSQLFNPESFIDCGRFEDLRECAQYAVFVHSSPELYAQLRRQPPITNVSAFQEAFSWHPAVASNFLADAVAKHLEI